MKEDEFLEITPKSIRLRKDHLTERKKRKSRLVYMSFCII